MDRTAIAECMRMSFADTPFPEVVRRLNGAGVNSYRADLIRLQTAYYDQERDLHDSAIPLNDSPAIGDNFHEADVVAAVRAIQRGEIGYAEFLRRIMQAGCASYGVFIRGGKAIYFGRDGEFYVEAFSPPVR